MQTERMWKVELRPCDDPLDVVCKKRLSNLSSWPHMPSFYSFAEEQCSQLLLLFKSAVLTYRKFFVFLWISLWVLLISPFNSVSVLFMYCLTVLQEFCFLKCHICWIPARRCLILPVIANVLCCTGDLKGMCCMCWWNILTMSDSDVCALDVRQNCCHSSDF